MFLLSIIPSQEASAAFIRPLKPDDPLIYGVRNGICVAVYPYALDARDKGGPRGLLRVGYQENGKFHLINYIAVQPVVDGDVGYSELERGQDGLPGKRFWVGGSATDGGMGVMGNVGGVVRQTPQGSVLTFYLFVEKFANGAEPVVEVDIHEMQPDRVEFRTFSAADGRAMQRCDLSATMGNQSRCRYLWLGHRPIFAPDLYAGYDGTGFVEHGRYDLSDLRHINSGDVVAAISPDEFEPREVWPLPDQHWHHDGRWMAQFWLKPSGTYDHTLQCRVNGRRDYWGGAVPIPGGISFENFEFREAFKPGQVIWFGFDAGSPKRDFGFPYDVSPSAAPRRSVPPLEQEALRRATATGRQLTNGDFSQGLDGWTTEDGALDFQVERSSLGNTLTTLGDHGDSDMGRLYQCFQVPSDANHLSFMMSGGSDAARLYVALWSGSRLVRKMTARDDDTPFRVCWNVSALRKTFVTLEIVDRKSGPWGFLTAEGFAFDQ